MRIPILTFGAFASVLTLNAFADTTSSTVTSKNYVDAQDALKQDVIDAEMLELEFSKGTISLPTLVSYDNTDNLTGTKYGIVNDGGEFDAAEANEKLSEVIPTMGYMQENLDSLQLKIPASGYAGTDGAGELGAVPANAGNSWLYADIKGTGLVTKTSTDGWVGERKIFEASDVSGYHAQGLTQLQKDIQDISIPTVGAMMTAISNGVNAATPTGNPNTIANFDSNGALGSGIATYTGAAAYNATNDSAKIPTMAGVTNYAQAKKVCVGWPDGTTVADATHTDANCVLWNLPD